MTISNLLLVNLSYGPLMFTFMIFFFINTMNNYFWMINSFIYIFFSLFMLFYFLLQFFFMLNIHNFFMGFFMKKKNNILINGFMLFIISESMVFVSLFWSYFHNAFSPNMFMGNFWPPKGLISANPTSMIIFGTSILLSSSLIIMISHNNLVNKNFKTKSLLYLMLCIIMGMLFIDMQILEMSNYFMKLNFNFNDSIFSSSFLFTTSLHASHVILGMFGLSLMFFFLYYYNLTLSFFLSYEFSVWYWHFVDYIWIGVFSLFY
uniref:Cytochrome c oxidase subunit 3 n=1 Tax=Tetranychus malaysiensis TaxID=1215688 RepID=A0A075X909_TETML|nr:cytochrome c oxidase subunit III [Tetranychus malaysiensis]AIH15668.1 cytochrome c oxidase subunit III [Tetranychus malaysiensis]